MTNGVRSASAAENFEDEAGREISDAEMKCNPFVLAVIRRTVDKHFPNTLADDFADSHAFSEVDRPARGDLIYWSGHVGIVLDPHLKTFIGSQTSTGVDQASYGWGYWAHPLGFLRWQGR